MIKKITLLVFAALAVCAFNDLKAQSPRLQLLEYFDNTSIPPFGAVANANVDSLMINYSDKITCIKYHVAWGSQTGTDPMNLHNPTQVDTRVKYYNVTADPHAKQDGAVPAASTFAGQPSFFKSSHILKRDTVASPFEMNVSHWLNTAGDTLFTQTIIKKTDSVATSSNPLVAHVVVLEKRVYFAVAPGVSGDKIFHNVMKYMLPGDTGTVLPAMNIGDSVIFQYPWKLTNVYNASELCVVSFVQHRDSTYREVYQAGQSFPVARQLDAQVSVFSPNKLSCDSIDFEVELRNIGLDTLKTCKLSYQVDAGAPDTILWTGVLATGKMDKVLIHLTGLQGGSHQIKVISFEPNGGVDMNKWTDTTTAVFKMAAANVAAPFSEGFQGTPTFPSNWSIINPNFDQTWTTGAAGAFGYSNRSARLSFYDIPQGYPSDQLLPPPLDLSSDTGSIYCVFSLAHAGFAKQAGDTLNYFDTLDVGVSVDCGKTWTTLWMKSDTALSTAPNQSATFTPGIKQWRYESVDLTAYVGQADVQLRFNGRSGYGNNLYIDDINISHASTGISEYGSIAAFEVYPNPSNGLVHLLINSNQIASSKIIVTNLVGDAVHQQNIDARANASYTVDLSNLPSGLYFVTLKSNEQRITRKLMIQR